MSSLQNTKSSFLFSSVCCVFLLVFLSCPVVRVLSSKAHEFDAEHKISESTMAAAGAAVGAVTQMASAIDSKLYASVSLSLTFSLPFSLSLSLSDDDVLIMMMMIMMGRQEKRMRCSTNAFMTDHDDN